MPLYEYRCQFCGAVIEALQRFSDEPLTVHENCGGTLERLLSVPTFQFKGSGWYVTDYARGGNGKGSNGGKKESEPSPAKAESKPEPSSKASQPAAKK